MQVTDPVCGMSLDSAKAAAVDVFEGQTYHFCSDSCHNRFRAAPEQFVKSPPAGQTCKCGC